MHTVSKLPKYTKKPDKYYNKLSKIEMLSIQECLYFQWIKQKYHAAYTSPINQDMIQMKSESSASTFVSDSQNADNMFVIKSKDSKQYHQNNFNQHICEENTNNKYIEHGPGFRCSRQSPPPPPLKNAALLSHDPQLKVKISSNGHAPKSKRSKRIIIGTEPCTPSSDEEQIVAFEVDPQPKGANITADPAVIQVCSAFVMEIPEMLMQSYPLPVKYSVIDQELRTKYNDGLQTTNVFESYDYMDLTEDGYVYIYPAKWQKLLISEQRERILSLKLQLLSNSIHPDGIAATEDNVNSFFEHYIGWIPCNEDHEFLSTQLAQKYRISSIHNYSKRKALQDILSYEDILCCALKSVGHKGCSGAQLKSTIWSRFRIRIDLKNPYIKQKLDEICDPNTFKIRNHYKLGVRTRNQKKLLLNWWSETYEKWNAQYDENYNWQYFGNGIDNSLKNYFQRK